MSTRLSVYCLQTVFRSNILYHCLNQRKACLHVCGVILRYQEQIVKQDSAEIDVLTKSTAPTVVVSESAEELKPRAVGSFFNISIFYDEHVNKFVNCMMRGGNKSVAQKVMSDTFERIKKIQLRKFQDGQDVEVDPLKIFHGALMNAKPILGTQTMKKKGKNFQVPYPLPDNRRRFLAIKWFITTARARPGNDVPMSEKLSKDILDAYHNEGSVIQKKVDYHKRAELNRAFAHYRWW